MGEFPPVTVVECAREESEHQPYEGSALQMYWAARYSDGRFWLEELLPSQTYKVDGQEWRYVKFAVAESGHCYSREELAEMRRLDDEIGRLEHECAGHEMTATDDVRALVAALVDKSEERAA